MVNLKGVEFSKPKLIKYENQFIKSYELYRLISIATKARWNKLSRSIQFADTLCFDIRGESVGLAVVDISLEKIYAFIVLY